MAGAAIRFRHAGDSANIAWYAPLDPTVHLRVEVLRSDIERVIDPAAGKPAHRPRRVPTFFVTVLSTAGPEDTATEVARFTHTPSRRPATYALPASTVGRLLRGAGIPGTDA